jgi:hypothetical protein
MLSGQGQTFSMKQRAPGRYTITFSAEKNWGLQFFIY